MSQANVIASASVLIGADTSGLDRATQAMAAKVIAAEKQIRAELARTEAARKAAVASLAAGNAGAAGSIAQLAIQQDRLNRQLEATATAARKVAGAIQAAHVAQVSGQAGPGGGRGAAAGRAALDASRLIEDVSVAGPLGGLNNIPSIVQGIGQAAGLATTAVTALTAAFSIAATAAYLLYSNWSKLAPLFGQTRTEAEEMDLLAKATDRTAEATRKLAEYQEREAEVQSQRGLKSKAMQAQKAGVEEILGEVGQGKLAGDLAGHAKDLLISGDKDARDAQAAIEARKATTAGQFGPGQVDKGLAPLEKNLKDAVIKAAENLLAGAALNPEKLNALIAEVEKKPGAYPKDFAKKLKEQTKEGREAKASRDNALADEDEHNAENEANYAKARELAARLAAGEAEQELESNEVDRKASEKRITERIRGRLDIKRPDAEGRPEHEAKFRAERLAEIRAKLEKDGNPQMFGSTSDYLKSIQSAGVNKDDEAKRILEEAIKQNKILEDIAANTAVASAGRPPARQVA